MKKERESYVFQGEMPARPFNALAREYGRQLSNGSWVLPISRVKKVHEQILDGEKHVNLLGPFALSQLDKFLEQKKRQRS